MILKPLTTHQIARLSGVSSKTVRKWLDCGLLKGWKVPGTRVRRCDPRVLHKFLLEHGMPVSDALGSLTGGSLTKQPGPA